MSSLCYVSMHVTGARQRVDFYRLYRFSSNRDAIFALCSAAVVVPDMIGPLSRRQQVLPSICVGLRCAVFESSA